MIAIIRRLLRFSGKHAAKVRWAYLFAFLKALCTNMPVFLGIYVLDRLIGNTADLGFVVLLCGLLLLFLVLQAVFQNITDRLQAGTGYEIFAEKRLEFGEHLRRLPMGYFTAGNLGRISTILSQDMVYIEEQAMSAIANVASDIFAQLILTVFLFTLHPLLGAVALVTEIAALLVARFMMKVSVRNAARRQQAIEDLTGSVLEYTEGLSVIKSYNMTGASAKSLRGDFRKMSDANIAFEEEYTPYERGQLIVYGVGMTLLLTASVFLYQEGALSTTFFAGMLLFVFQFFAPMRDLYTRTSVFAIMSNSLDRIQSVFDEKEIDDTGECAVPAIADADHEIEFRDVSFSYGQEEVLHDISFAADHGQMVALIGESGSGKTTIANLLARFWDVSAGEILFRGVNIKNLALSDLMDQVSMVFQNVYLFEDTIYNNIVMGSPGATREQVVEVAKKARCYDFIKDLPYGFDTRIGEGGASLSGGEAQRISIARCMLKDAPLIILDEATASIDADNEAYIQQALSELCRGKTTIVIAHKLNTVRNSDQMIVLQKGKILEQGSREELLAKGGAYCRMLAAENAAVGWSDREAGAA